MKDAFLDQLPRNSALHIRYESRPAKEKTVSFLYTLAVHQLRFVVATCAPREVMRALRTMNSVLATP